MTATSLRGIHSIEDFDLDDQRVFLRCDFNVPISNGVIQDDYRIRAALPTIQYALEKGAKVVLASHWGRPTKALEDRPQFSLEPVARHLNLLLDKEILLLEDPRGEAAKPVLAGLKSSQIVLLENLRFETGEEANDRELAAAWLEFTDIYINEAFGASHRAHASVVALPGLVEKKGIGFLMKKEIEMLETIRSHPAHPFTLVLGGAKVSDKIELIDMLIDKVDVILIGGAMAYTFLKATGHSVGASRVEGDKVKFASELMERMRSRGKKLLVPQDHVVVKDLRDVSSTRVEVGASIMEGWMGVDIGPQTRQLFAEALAESKTVFWNGPMGIFETPEFSSGSFAVAHAMVESSATTVVGGGDSAACALASGVVDRFSHVSTGGGASLEFLQGQRLVGLEALRPPKRSESL